MTAQIALKISAEIRVLTRQLSKIMQLQMKCLIVHDTTKNSNKISEFAHWKLIDKFLLFEQEPRQRGSAVRKNQLESLYRNDSRNTISKSFQHILQNAFEKRQWFLEGNKLRKFTDNFVIFF